MGIELAWDNEDQVIIRLTYDRPWTWNDFYTAYDNMDMMINSVSHDVSLLIDVRKAGFPPSGAPQHFKRVTQTKHPNIRNIVFVGLPLIVRSFLSIVTANQKGNSETNNFLFMSSIDVARTAIIKDHAERKAETLVE